MGHLLFINRHGPDSHAPTGRLLRELAEDLTTAGWPVEAICGKHDYLVRESLPSRIWHSLGFVIQTLLVLLRKRADVVICMTDPPMLYVPVIWLSRLRKIKVIVWSQDVWPELGIVLGVIPKWIGVPLTWLAYHTLKRATLLVTIGRCMQRHYQQHGIDSVYIPNWVDGKVFHPIETPAHLRWPEAYYGHLGAIHGYVKPEIPHIKSGGHSDGYWNHLLNLSDAHVIALRADCAGLAVPLKFQTAFACNKPIRYLGPLHCEVAYACGELAVSRMTPRQYFKRVLDRPIGTRKWKMLLNEYPTV